MHDLIRIFIDDNDFTEIGANRHNPDAQEPATHGAGVITGYGAINGRNCAVFAQDKSVKGGTIGKSHGEKIAYLIRWAIKTKQPIIGIFNSAGARVQEGIVSVEATAEVVKESVNASGYIPSIAIVVGPCAGGAAYLPVLFDFVIMVENSGTLFLTGPKIIDRVLQQKVSNEELGGFSIHAIKSGLVHFGVKSVREAFELTTRLLKFLPNHYQEQRIKQKSVNSNKINWIKLLENKWNFEVDVEKVIAGIVDDADQVVYNKLYAPNVHCSFCFLDGRSIGVVANQALQMGGCMDVNATNKALRFIQICDAYNIPLLFILNSPGFLPGKIEEENRILGAGAKLFNVVVTSTIPRITLIIGKGTGGSYGGMNCRNLGADLIYAWPSAKFKVMGKDAALSILKDEEDEAHDFSSPYWAANEGIIDDVIMPEESRSVLINGFRMLEQKVVKNPAKKRTILPMN